jgi:hypothetical protein
VKKKDESAGRAVCILYDNGSLRVAPTMHLRALAELLEHKLGLPVVATSLLHSDGLDANLLNGQPAVLLKPAIRGMLESGMRQFIILPQFFGPSRAIMDFVPDMLADFKVTYPDAFFFTANCLFDSADNSALLLAEILRDRVMEVIDRHVAVPEKVVMVDHGTPVVEVNMVRRAVAKQLGECFSKSSFVVQECSMERRDGQEFDFNEPLLEDLLQEPEFCDGVIVAPMFFSKGRHAGPGGDIDSICSTSPVHPLFLADPIGLHPNLINLLVQRFHEALPH